ncbi:hypothetical protein ACFL27_19120 [candidate division CSSED10-310 bacterium]|uniref:Phosphatase PAP2 family protein n=1 Tax=candidate division CSSED10-310 bacterium TaxID=2855610 RepID=A0ABV6Z1M9_UNCC1
MPMHQIDIERVETRVFERDTLFTRSVRSILRSIIIPFSDPQHKEAYKEQFAIASRNVEITVEDLFKFSVRHPLKMALVMGVTRNWLTTYFGAQNDSKHKERFLVYTQFDNKIPFIPAADIMYTYMLAQIAFVANEISKYLSWSEMKNITESFVALNNLGVSVFKQYPTVIPRFFDHNRLSLKVIQFIDGPVNCCPSLHIAYSVFLDNVARTIFGDTKKETFQAIRYSTIRMFNSVLYTKQHALIDVAFGILCAEIIYKRRVAHDFNNLFCLFESLRLEHPDIDYTEIVRIYTEGVAIYQKLDNLPETIGTYLTANGYLQVDPDAALSTCYFDTKQKKLIVQKDHGA